MSIRRAAAAYDIVAETYEDRFVDELAGKPRDRELLDGLAAGTRGLLLDLGCGPGHIGSHLEQHGRDVIGVDVSPAMAARAAGRLTATVLADMRFLPFRQGGVGGIVAFYSLIHLPRADLIAAFGEMVRALEPRGSVLVSAHEGDGTVEVQDFLGHVVDLDASFFRPGELTDGATAAGLQVVTLERRPPYDSEGSTVRLYLSAVRP